MTVQRPDLRSRWVRREINGRIVELTRRFEPVENSSDLTMLVFCECGRAGCVRPMEMTLAEFEAVREGPGRCVVSSEHIDEDVSVLAQRNGYALVEIPERLPTAAERPGKESTSFPTTASPRR